MVLIVCVNLAIKVELESIVKTISQVKSSYIVGFLCLVGLFVYWGRASQQVVPQQIATLPPPKILHVEGPAQSMDDLFIARFRALVDSHPDTNFRDSIKKEINEERLSWSVSPESGVFYAQFVAFKDLEKEVIQILLSPAFFFDPEMNDQKRQLALYHEFQHYLQYRSDSVTRMVVTNIMLRKLSLEDVRLVYKNEVSALIAEAELAKRVNWTELLPIYQAYDREGPRVVPSFVAQNLAASDAYRDFAEDIIRWSKE